MKTRKLVERSQLHRLSQIDYLRGEYERYQQQLAAGKKLRMKDICIDGMSMQEALAVYMQRVIPACVPPGEEEKKVEKKSEEAISDNMMVVAVYQIANQRKQDAQKNTKKKQGRMAVGIPLGSISAYEEVGVPPVIDFDKLDVNRGAGYLLYSYDKKGTHSILGDHVKPGSYGDRITDGDFGKKA